MIRSVSAFYLNYKIKIEKAEHYEVICKTILDKYPNLKKDIIKMCNFQNQSKSGKLLQGHFHLDTHSF